MSGKRYRAEFKIEAVRQATDRGYSVTDVAERLGVTTKSLYEWVRGYGEHAEKFQTAKQQDAEIRKVKVELRRVTEERDIPEKRPRSTLPRSPGKVRVYQSTQGIGMNTGYRIYVVSWVFTPAGTMRGVHSLSQRGRRRIGGCGA